MAEQLLTEYDERVLRPLFDDYVRRNLTPTAIAKQLDHAHHRNNVGGVYSPDEVSGLLHKLYGRVPPEPK